MDSRSDCGDSLAIDCNTLRVTPRYVVLPPERRRAVYCAALAIAVSSVLISGCGRLFSAEDSKLRATEVELESLLIRGCATSNPVESYYTSALRPALDVVRKASRDSDFERPFPVASYMTPSDRVEKGSLLFVVAWLESGDTVARVVIENENRDILVNEKIAVASFLPDVISKCLYAHVRLDAESSTEKAGFQKSLNRNVLFLSRDEIDRAGGELMVSLVTKTGYRTKPIKIFVDNTVPPAPPMAHDPGG
ncbi:MAG: hypothetical protein K1X71_00495 [Pirellulales bacterium]|nr:hypothetical protein [Pirellulales bacterium]